MVLEIILLLSRTCVLPHLDIDQSSPPILFFFQRLNPLANMTHSMVFLSTLYVYMTAYHTDIFKLTHVE